MMIKQMKTDEKKLAEQQEQERLLANVEEQDIEKEYDSDSDDELSVSLIND
jgi:hypothetical protein